MAEYKMQLKQKTEEIWLLEKYPLHQHRKLNWSTKVMNLEHVSQKACMQLK